MKLGDKVIYKDKEETVIGICKNKDSYYKLIVTYNNGWLSTTPKGLHDYNMIENYEKYGRMYGVGLDEIELINKEINFDIL